MRKFFSSSLIFFSSFLLAFLFAEVLLRFNNQNPWGYFTVDLNEPTINQPDEIKGWDLMPGNYIFQPYSESGKKFNVTINQDKTRYTGKIPQKTLGDIAIFGGSISLGHAVDDKKHYPFLLQKKIRNYAIKNYSVAGYGTHQSFLKIEEVVKKNKKIKIIIVAFDKHAEIRNIGDEFWLRNLTKYSKRGVLSLPYASIEENSGLIKRHKPVKYLKLPLREQSSIITKIEKRIMKYKLKTKQNPAEVTKQIILEIEKLSNNNNIKFFFLNLSGDKAVTEYLEIFKTKKINYIDCEVDLNSTLVVAGEEGHPNAEQHQMLSDCIFKNLKINAT